MKPSILKTTFWLCLFATAMGFLESSVVIYLRELYYPKGFQFPLQIIPQKIAIVEICREAATIIMLIGAAYLAGTTKLIRFAYFLMAFAVWDLFYYIFLYVFIGWPQNLFTWDILFLIPFPWTGPVLAPCLVSVGMIIFSFSILLYSRNKTINVSRSQWLLITGGCVIIIVSFLYDYFEVVQSQQGSTNFLPSSRGLLYELQYYIPVKFNWPLFLSGFTLSSLGTLLFLKKQSSNPK
jgi:hypothetical protein